LAWLYVHGVYPDQIDHENRIRHDKSTINLRASNSYQNSRNKLNHQITNLVLLEFFCLTELVRRKPNGKSELACKFLGDLTSVDAVGYRKSSVDGFTFVRLTEFDEDSSWQISSYNKPFTY